MHNYVITMIYEHIKKWSVLKSKWALKSTKNKMKMNFKIKK